MLADESTGTEAFADAREPLAQAFKAGRHARRRRLRGDRQPLQVEGLRHAGPRRSGQRQRPSRPPGQLAGDLRQRVQDRCAASPGSSWPVTSTPTRTRTRSRSSTRPATPTWSRPATPTRRATTSTARSARSTTCSPTRPPSPTSRTSTSGRSTATSRSTTSTAASTTTSPTSTQPNPFQSSDHNPEIVGINMPVEPATRDIQILGTNDFHGRHRRTTRRRRQRARAVLAGAVKQLRAANPDTVFAAAGDLIGASTFESFIQKDKPTIDALNEAGLEVSAVGNHEFDQGYDDLVNRVMAPYDATTNPRVVPSGQYIAANVRSRPTTTRTPCRRRGPRTSVGPGRLRRRGDRGPSRSWSRPGGIAEIKVTDIVDRGQRGADDLQDRGRRRVVMLVHEGAPNTNCTHDGRRPDLGLRFDRQRRQRQHRRDRVGSHPPGLRLLVRGSRLGPRPRGHRASGGVGGSVRHRAEQVVFTVDTATGEVQTQDPERREPEDRCRPPWRHWPAACRTTRPTRRPRRS